MNGLPPSPFISVALSAETLPSEFSGKSHCSDGSPHYEAMFGEMPPEDPPPIFLRSPSQAFMRALFELSNQ